MQEANAANAAASILSRSVVWDHRLWTWSLSRIIGFEVLVLCTLFETVAVDMCVCGTVCIIKVTDCNIW